MRASELLTPSMGTKDDSTDSGGNTHYGQFVQFIWKLLLLHYGPELIHWSDAGKRYQRAGYRAREKERKSSKNIVKPYQIQFIHRNNTIPILGMAGHPNGKTSKCKWGGLWLGSLSAVLVHGSIIIVLGSLRSHVQLNKLVFYCGWLMVVTVFGTGIDA